MPTKYNLENLNTEEKEQLKDYVNAIKETKKAIVELLTKTKPVVNSEAKNPNWGGSRKDMIMTLDEED